MNEREKTDHIVIHCSDTPDEREVEAKEIKKWHVEERGWEDIGYHFVIRRNGLIEVGRDFVSQGAHAKPVNKTSLGICLVGRSEFDERQFESLRDLVQLILRLFPDCKVVGHSDVDPKKPKCPNFDVIKWFNGAIPSIRRP